MLPDKIIHYRSSCSSVERESFWFKTLSYNMTCQTHMLEFKVNSSLFQSEVELTAVKNQIKEILRGYGFKMLNMQDTCVNPGFIETFHKDGKLQLSSLYYRPNVSTGVCLFTAGGGRCIPSFRTSELGPPPQSDLGNYPLATDIWWSSLETCSNLFT